MTKEEKDKMLRALANNRNEYAKECNRRIAEENGRYSHNEESCHMRSHFEVLKELSEDMRRGL